MTSLYIKEYLDNSTKSVGLNDRDVFGTAKFLELLENSFNNDFVGRKDDSEEADFAEAEAYSKLISKYAGSIEDEDNLKLNPGKVVTAKRVAREAFDFAYENAGSAVRGSMNTSMAEARKTPFIFGYAYDQFVNAKISSGFKFISTFDNVDILARWLDPLPKVMARLGQFVPSVVRNLVCSFILTKISYAECQITSLCDMLYKVLSDADFWHAVYHKSSTMDDFIASRLLMIYCMDATLWVNSPFTILYQQRRWSAEKWREHARNLSILKDVVTILISPSSNAVQENPELAKDVMDILNPKSSRYSKSGVAYLKKLICEDITILASPGNMAPADDLKTLLLSDYRVSFSEEFTNLARFVVSADYAKFEDIVRSMSRLNPPPIDIDISILAAYAKAVMQPRSGDRLFERLMNDFDPIEPIYFLTGYVSAWAAHLIRFNTVWSLRYADRVVDAVKVLAPEFNEYSNNPILLLKKASEKWLEDEQHIKAEQEREVAERAAKMKEAAAKLERERLEAIEKMESERKGKLKAEGFQLASDSGRYEKWFKDNTCRIFFKTTSPEEKKGVLVGLEELGISASKVRNIKNPAGIIRTITIGEDEIYSDSLIENALHKAARFKPEGPVFNTEIVSTAFDLVFDKTFFELEWLDKAIVRAMDDKVSIQDARYCTKVMRDRGIIGQIKGKKNGPKIFALTPEGYSLYQIQKDYPNLPILAVPWEKYIGEEVAERLGTLQYFDINTRPVKDIDKMIAGKTPRFLDKYYVTAI